LENDGDAIPPAITESRISSVAEATSRLPPYADDVGPGAPATIPVPPAPLTPANTALPAIVDDATWPVAPLNSARPPPSAPSA
jgi:hypothetical protein